MGAVFYSNDSQIIFWKINRKTSSQYFHPQLGFKVRIWVRRIRLNTSDFESNHLGYCKELLTRRPPVNNFIPNFDLKLEFGL